LLEDVNQAVRSHFQTPGDCIVILGTTAGHLGGSAYWAEACGFVGGGVAPVDLAAERRLQLLLVTAAKAGLLRSAHDCSEGGLAVTIAEAAIGSPYAAGALGADVDLASHGPGDDIGLLYGEDAGRVVASCRPADADALLALAREHEVPALVAGTVGDSGGTLTVRTGRATYSWAASKLRTVYFEAIPRRMRAVATDRDGGA